MKNKLLTLLLFGSTSALSSFATCMSDCQDWDGGVQPNSFGVTKVSTSCSPPGGPVHTNTQYWFDECREGAMVEFSCSSKQPGANGIIKTYFQCKKCDPTRKGICLVRGKSIPPVAGLGEQPEVQTSTTSGEGPHPEETLAPSVR
jgi:hypothetical protein